MFPLLSGGNPVKFLCLHEVVESKAVYNKCIKGEDHNLTSSRMTNYLSTPDNAIISDFTTKRIISTNSLPNKLF